MKKEGCTVESQYSMGLQDGSLRMKRKVKGEDI